MAQELCYALATGTFTLLGAGIGLFGALYINNRQRKEDKRKEASRAFLEESLLLLERAHETFTRCGTNPPMNDRVFWLSTARMIVRFQDMRPRLTESEHRDIADEHEEYWRLRFYALLKENRNSFGSNYFAPSHALNGLDVIDNRSIAVIFDFATWRQEIADPLESVNSTELFARRAVLRGFGGVEGHLRRYESYWAEVMRCRGSGSEGS